MATTLSLLASFGLFFVYAGLFEYAFHRWILHRPSKRLAHPYHVHTFLHHRVFGGDASYHVQCEGDKDLILFQWWQAPLLLVVHAPIVWGVQMGSGVAIFWGGMAALASYYGLYEYLHWSMHSPTGRWIECTRLFGLWTRSTDSTTTSGERTSTSSFRWAICSVAPIGRVRRGEEADREESAQRR